MIYLLYGSDVQKSRQKLQKITAEYRAKAGGGLDHHQFDAEEDGFEKFKGALRSGSLFTPKKLLAVKYFSLSAWDREGFFKLLKTAKGKKGTVVVLWDRELRREDVAALRPYCDGVEEFKTEAKAAPDNKDIFRLGDAFFVTSRRRDALLSLLRLLEAGEDPMRIFSYLSGHLRTLVAVKRSSIRGGLPPQYLKIHPYVAQKTAAIVRDVPLAELRAAFRRFLEEDFKIKNGLSKPEEALFSLLAR